jgi:hypothetical protein
VAALGFACSGSSQAQGTITVRVVKARDGKPLHGYHAWLQFRTPGEKKWRRVMQETASDGIANFHLEEPMPEAILVSLGIHEAACSGQANIVVLELQKQGKAIGNECGVSETAKRLSPKPGEIILFVRPMPLWARILAPLEKE